MDNIHEKLQDIFRKVFNDDGFIINDNMNANDVEGWDSLTHINLIVIVEKEFGIKFTVGEVNKLKNIGDFKNLISERLSE